MDIGPDDVLAWWFDAGDDPQKRWFVRSDAVDAEIRDRFGDVWAKAAGGELDSWADTPRGRLALIVVLDQLSRNLHRDSPVAYRQDARARALAEDAIARGWDAQLAPFERAFLYMPLMHAEDLAAQELSVAKFEALAAEQPADRRAPFESFADYARKHRDVIARFGRFPHRNAELGRDTTDAERAFLATGRGF